MLNISVKVDYTNTQVTQDTGLSLIKGFDKISIKLISFLVGQFGPFTVGLSFKSDGSVTVIISVFCFSIASLIYKEGRL